MAEQWFGGLGCGGRNGKRGQAEASQGVDEMTQTQAAACGKTPDRKI